jgi:pentatricopeptide repeat protein
MNLRIHRNDYTKKLLYRHDFEVRRRRALSFILLRLNRYRTHSGLEDSYALMNDGRYRSLRRRYANYSRKKSELIDLTVQQALLLYPRGRVKAFAFLDRRAYPELRRKTHYLGVYHDPRCREWTAKLFRGLAVRNEKVLMNNWMSFDGPTRNLIWPYLLVYLLHIWPGRALYFLQLLVQRPEVDNIQPDVLADAFGYLSVVYAQKFKLERSLVDDVDEHVAGLVPAFTHFLRKYRSVLKHVCPQDLIYRVSILAHGEDLKPVFDILEDEKIFLLFHTILHYTNEFSKAGEIDYALRCLAAIETRARDQPQLVTIANLQSVRWSCALLLRKSAGKRGEEYHRTTDIVARLVELGMKLDNLLYNVIMHNAMDAGDYSTAFQVYNSLETNGLKPDKYTFAILLHGCTMTEDPFKFNDFADYCADVAVEMRDAWVAADYLYYIYICQQRSDETDNDLRLYNYSKITEAYARYFNTAGVDMFATADFPPLAQQHSSESPTNPDFNPMQPPPIALYLILQFRIQIAAVSLDQEVWHLYLRFRQVVRAKHDPVLNKLAQNPVIWNAFLLAFTRKNKFEWASDVIKDMADSFPYPKPNVYSWNIFMQGFFKTDQIPAAERIFEIMRARGIDPDRYTYGTLLRGFVRRGHYDRIGQVMEYVEDEEQMAPDLITMLGRVHNRERLVKVMEESEVRKRERKVREERKKEAAVRKRWRKVFVDVDEDEGAKLDADESEKGLTFGSVLPRVARQGLEPSGENGGLRPRSIDESFL